MELVTGHAAEAHITAEQVSRFIQGITVMEDSTVYRLNNGNNAALSIDTLTLTIATGELIVDGFHFTNEEDYPITFDATTESTYSRIDKVVAEILEDQTTGVQSVSILVVQGTEAETPTAPDTPTTPESDTDTLLAVGLIATVTVADSVISDYTDSTELYAGSFVTQEDYEADMGDTDISDIGDGSVTSAIDTVNTAAAAAQTDATTALDMLMDDSVDVYSESAEYAEGDYVVYNNTLYVCNTACSAGTWATNSGYFTETTVATALTTLNSSLTIKTLTLSSATITSSGSYSTSLSGSNTIILASRFIDDNTNYLLIPIYTINASGYLMFGFYSLNAQSMVTSSTTFSGVLYYLDLS